MHTRWDERSTSSTLKEIGWRQTNAALSGCVEDLLLLAGWDNPAGFPALDSGRPLVPEGPCQGRNATKAIDDLCSAVVHGAYFYALCVRMSNVERVPVVVQKYANQQAIDVNGAISARPSSP